MLVYMLHGTLRMKECLYVCMCALGGLTLVKVLTDSELMMPIMAMWFMCLARERIPSQHFLNYEVSV